ncbi:MAG: formylglycine-generating enzyme family protein [Acidimicrobiales bacterium]
MDADDRPAASPCCAPRTAPVGTEPSSAVTSNADRPGLDTIEAAPTDTSGQVLVPGGTFTMGDAFGEGYSADGEQPAHRVTVAAFFLDPVAVTNERFAAFVEATGWVTDAEHIGVSAVFHLAFDGDPSHVRHRVGATPWWLAVDGADWRHPEGPHSSIDHRGDHPAVHVSWFDAHAFCRWAGTTLPTEAQWEYAARGGLAGRRFPWGDELTNDGEWRCNIFQGHFPTDNTGDDGHLTTAPVDAFTPNGYGLHQLAGNVWEWCADWFSPFTYRDRAAGPVTDPGGPAIGSSRVMRGGSYLCHDSYCHRYRVAARSSTTPDSATANIGFRCANPALATSERRNEYQPLG